uniref:Uncharacterized protein n=1 Tax=Onchocerca volvulus TaxID=6282 RepID=A0A8R1TKS1_ONCVO
MPRSLTHDLEEGEICDDEEIDINQPDVAEYSSASINERTKCFQSLNHNSSKSLYSNNNSKIPYQSAIYSQINGDNLQASNNEKEKNETTEDKSECFDDYEVNEENDEEYLDESEDELEVTDFQDELVEYQSNFDEESDDDDEDEFSDEIVCSEGIISASEFHSKIATLAVDTEDRTDRNTTGNIEVRRNSVEEVPVDDSWIFHSLDEPSRIVMRGNETMDSCMLPGSEGNLEKQLAKTDPSKFEVIIDVTVSGNPNCGDTETVGAITDEKQILHEESNNQAERIVELEKKFAEERDNYARNMYSLLVTARAQIATLQKENKKLEIKLERNHTMKCPKCKHEMCIKNNLLKPKYIKVLKGRCAIEMLFDNLAIMEEWLAANYLDVNPDGLPVVLEIPRKPTLTSTNSLLAPKTNSVRDIRRDVDKVTPISSSVFRNLGSISPIAMRQNIQPANAARVYNRHSMKQNEKLNHAMQSGKAQKSSSLSDAYDSCDNREKRSREKKLSGSDKYKEQQHHYIPSIHTSSDISFDHDQRRHFNFSKSCNSRMSHYDLNASMVNCNVRDQEHLSVATDSFGNRSEYRNPCIKYRRRRIRSPVNYRPTKENFYRRHRDHSRSNQIRKNVERKL